MKKLNKLFFIREYTQGNWAVHVMRFTVVYRKFWIFKLAYLRHTGYDVFLKPSKAEAVSKARQERIEYIEALKYVKK
jgi:hypothetical protein